MGFKAVTLELVVQCPAGRRADYYARQVEKGAHEILQGRRHKGEWFWATAGEAAAAIRTAAAQAGIQIAEVPPFPTPSQLQVFGKVRELSTS
jgi:hypothetical protein